MVISGCVGPHDDGYSPATKLTAAAAQDYHATQIATFGDTAADMVTAITMTYAEEATGVARAATEHGLPAAISFTVETDGHLPSGQALGEAIRQVDGDTGGAPAYSPGTTGSAACEPTPRPRAMPSWTRPPN